MVFLGASSTLHAALDLSVAYESGPSGFASRSVSAVYWPENGAWRADADYYYSQTDSDERATEEINGGLSLYFDSGISMSGGVGRREDSAQEIKSISGELTAELNRAWSGKKITALTLGVVRSTYQIAEGSSDDALIRFERLIGIMQELNSSVAIYLSRSDYEYNKSDTQVRRVVRHNLRRIRHSNAINILSGIIDESRTVGLILNIGERWLMDASRSDIFNDILADTDTNAVSEHTRIQALALTYYAGERYTLGLSLSSILDDRDERANYITASLGVFFE